MVKFLLNEDDHPQNGHAPPLKTDGELLDAYSQTVVGVAQKVSDAVVHINVNMPGRQANRRQKNGSGSGFIISSDGYVDRKSVV